MGDKLNIVDFNDTSKRPAIRISIKLALLYIRQLGGPASWLMNAQIHSTGAIAGPATLRAIYQMDKSEIRTKKDLLEVEHHGT